MDSLSLAKLRYKQQFIIDTRQRDSFSCVKKRQKNKKGNNFM